MVKVVESIPVKVPGRTSFLVFFEYGEEKVAAMKSLRPAVWHKKLSA